MHICCVYVRQMVKVLAPIINIDCKYKIKYEYIPFGISYISSSLKQAGHTTELVYCTPYTYKKGITNYIEKEPQVFAISIMSGYDYKLALQLVRTLKIKYKNAKIIVGGIVVTTETERILNEMVYIDALCIGEGEKAVIEYIRQVEKNDYKKTDNLWIKVKNNVIKCDKAFSIENIDELPYPDRDGWNKWVEDTTRHSVFINRGCIYNCIFCVNTTLKEKSKNKFYRERSVESIIAEIDYLVKRYKNIEIIKFEGENALANIDNFKKLCLALKDYNSKLKKKILFNTSINFTPNLLEKDSDVIDLMKEANFKIVSFSLESGSFEIRKKIGKPIYTNEQFITFCNKLHDKEICILIYTMYCFPLETKESYWQTINCLRQCKPTFFRNSWLTMLNRPDNYSVRKITLIDIWRFYLIEYFVYSSYKSFIITLQLSFFAKLPDKISCYIINCLEKVETFIESKNNRNKMLAKEEFNKFNFQQAIKYFNKVKISDTDSWVYGDRAIAKMNIGDYKGALKDFDKVLELDPQEVYKQKKQECLELSKMKNK